MSGNCRKSWDFVTGLAVGLLVSTATALLLAELKYFIEQGHAARLLGIFPSFDDAYGGDRFEIAGGAMLDQMIERAGFHDEGAHERRMYREHGNEHYGDAGKGSIYFNEE
jgi:hypothetical protein